MISGPFNFLSSHQLEMEQHCTKSSKVGKTESFQKKPILRRSSEMVSWPFNFVSSHQLEMEHNFTKFSKVGKTESFQKTE